MKTAKQVNYQIFKYSNPLNDIRRNVEFKEEPEIIESQTRVFISENELNKFLDNLATYKLSLAAKQAQIPYSKISDLYKASRKIIYGSNYNGFELKAKGLELSRKNVFKMTVNIQTINQ